MKSGKRERAKHGEVPVQPLRSGAKHAIRSRFARPVRVQRVDRVTFPAWTVLIGIDKTGADVDEVAIVELAGCLKQRNGRGKIKPEQFEPVDLRWTHTAGGAMDNRRWAELPDGLHQTRGVFNVDLLKAHVGEVRKQRGVRVSHQ